MAESQTMLWIKDAKYYPQEKSIVIVGEEVETKRPITQQVLVKQFIEAYNLAAKIDDHEAWKFFASELKRRKNPCPLVWGDQK
jgi:hypothetical protein